MINAKILTLIIGFLVSLGSSLRTMHDVEFTDQVCIIPLHSFVYETCNDMDVTIDGNRMVVPIHFKNDLASIPRFLWPILPPQRANYVAPAILHDYMYTVRKWPRSYADAVFYSALRAQGTSWPVANIMWLGVRLGGAPHFNGKVLC